MKRIPILLVILGGFALGCAVLPLSGCRTETKKTTVELGPKDDHGKSAVKIEKKETKVEKRSE